MIFHDASLCSSSAWISIPRWRALVAISLPPTTPGIHPMTSLKRALADTPYLDDLSRAFPPAASSADAPPADVQRTEVTFIESNVADLPTLLQGMAGKEV